MEDKLLQSVKNKSYFNKAVEWYCHRYLFCIVERSWLALIASFLFVCVCLLLLNIYLLFPIKKDLNFVKYMNHSEDEFSVIHKLDFGRKEDGHTSIAKYLVKKYVEIYEHYKVIEPSYQENFIKNNSAHKVYKEFHDKLNADNLNISKRKIVKIDVKELYIDRSIADLVMFVGNATVIFITEQNKQVKDHTVEINFTLSNIQATLSNIIPFKFIVNNYKLR
jgi:type IV secretion system protein VirB8